MLALLFLALLALAPASALAIINPRFTPVHLVRQADAILAGTLQPGARADEWTLAGIETLKGAAQPEAILTLAAGEGDTLAEVRKLLVAGRGAPAMLFSTARDKTFLHCEGVWLTLRPGGRGRWAIHGTAREEDAVYAGGTDMLLRMTRYILADPRATVPASVGTGWAGRSRIATMDAPVSGMAAVEIQGSQKPCLFVASAKGDRLFRPKDGEDAMRDVTAEAKLDTRSRRFTWVDMDRDGLADLVSWDGQAITVWLAAKDGTFAPADPARTFPMGQACLGLAPISVSTDGAPAVLVSTEGRPFVLEPGGKRTALPASRAAGEAAGSPSACIVADFDNDGFADVLQPREGGGVLWRGRAGSFALRAYSAEAASAAKAGSGLRSPRSTGGFEPPVASPVSGDGGGGLRLALGDFDGDGFLDIFASDARMNQLWENDGKAPPPSEAGFGAREGRGGFRAVIGHAGSLSYKCPPGVSAALAADLNHDGRTDLALGYDDAGLVYHFNRGYRCLGEEGDLRLVGPAFADGPSDPGVRALAVADFNGNGGDDLAVAFARGEVFVYHNDITDATGLRLRLPKGVTGPLTASVWQGAVCVGTYSLLGHARAVFASLRTPGECMLKYRFPGKPERVRKLTLAEGVRDVILDE